MKTNISCIRQAAAIAAISLAGTAHAGGPLFLAGPDDPYSWDVSNPVPMYTDMGDLCDSSPWPWFGCLDNEQVNAVVAYSIGQWANVESSNFDAVIAGNFDDLGIGDVTGANANRIVGADNGGGYHVMYDSDSSILRDFFGVGPFVLGISSPEWSDGNNTITESWAVINVASVPMGDDGTMAAGVFTHEFGHGINLAHSQANGFVTYFGSPWGWVAWAPEGCSAPYDVSPITDWGTYQAWITDVAIPATETMYPMINPRYAGEAMGRVDKRDDMVALSNLYPGAGWPASHGSISGEILLKNGTTGLTGVNVVARNVADPLNDVVTVMSGDQTQGSTGPDGRFTINGLTPGADYVVYVESIYAGGFPTPPANLPSFQEYWNGADESADAAADDPCAWSTIPAMAGVSAQVDIAFNGIERAPTFVQIPLPSATDADNSGKVVVGSYGGQIAWRYDTKADEFDGVASLGSPKLANDGHTMTITQPYEGYGDWTVPPGMMSPGLWTPQHGADSFTLPNDEGCDGFIFAPYDVNRNANTVVGLAYRDGCPRPDYHPDGPNSFHAGVWTKKNGLEYLDMPAEVLPDEPNCRFDPSIPPWGAWVNGCLVSGARANTVSGDGRVIGGHVTAGLRRGAIWDDGEFMLLGEGDPKNWVGSIQDITADGSMAVGGLAGDNGWDAYVWSANGGIRNLGHITVLCEDIAPWVCDWVPQIDYPAEAFAISDSGDVVIGRAGDFWVGFSGFIWMEATGMVDLNEFLQGQGVMEAYSTNLMSPLAVSGDGKTIVGWGFTDRSLLSYAVTLDQVFVCNEGRSQLVGFPGAMIAKLGNGAELGLCEADRPIEP